MIAYNKDWLYNRHVRTQADEALREQCITIGEHEAIYKAKEVKFYTPNYFIRVGLALLTFVVIVFGNSFVGLLFSAGHVFFILLMFMGLACYGAAELIIRSKSHYNSGVDNMLVWMSALLVWGGCVWHMVLDNHNENSPVIMCFEALVITAALAVRFADSFLSICAALALILFLFFVYQHVGSLAAATTPFFMMLVSCLLYFVAANGAKRPTLLLYRTCLQCVSVVALLATYCAGNYYLVRALSGEMFHAYLNPRDTLPMGIFFWVWTFAIPFIYIGAGIRKKDILLIRVGIPLIAAAILTFRYYHAVIAPEVAMLLGGALLLAISWSLINYLRTPRMGFTFKPDTSTSDTPDIGRLSTKAFMNKATGK